jgi:hypothetical protein
MKLGQFSNMKKNSLIRERDRVGGGVQGCGWVLEVRGRESDGGGGGVVRLG